MAVLLREVICPKCEVVFWLCCACDRGHRYCSTDCRRVARQRAQHRARRKYARSERGRRKNRERQRRFRQRHPGYRQRISGKRNGSLFSSPAKCVVLRVCRTLPHPSAVVSSRPDPAKARSGWAPRERSACRRDSPCSVSKVRATARSPVEDGGRHCHLCGCAGDVVRQHNRRGRFRWSMREPPESSGGPGPRRSADATAWTAAPRSRAPP